MALDQLYGDTDTLVIASELTLNTTTPETTPGIYQLFVDLSNLVNGDTLEIRIKEKALSGGTQRTILTTTYTNAQGVDNELFVSPALHLMHGWDMTLTQTTGAERAFAWSIRQVA